MRIKKIRDCKNELLTAIRAESLPAHSENASGCLHGRAHLFPFVRMKRRIPQQAVANASALFILVLLLSGLGAAFLSIADHVSLENALYETISALCTVGLTTGITSSLCVASQLVLILFMFFGRLGIMTISVGFMAANRAEERVSYAETKIMIG